MRAGWLAVTRLFTSRVVETLNKKFGYINYILIIGTYMHCELDVIILLYVSVSLFFPIYLNGAKDGNDCFAMFLLCMISKAAKT